MSEQEKQTYTHQLTDQHALVAPVTKSQSSLEGNAAGAEMEKLIQIATTPPLGPVFIELTSSVAQSKQAHVSIGPVQDPPIIASAEYAKAGELLAQAKKPVVIVGLESRGQNLGIAIHKLVESLCCPTFTTYKAKGIIPDSHANTVGLFTGGSVESETIGQADLIVFIGLDPVELIPQPWRYKCPVLDISLVRHPVNPVDPQSGLYGNLELSVQAMHAYAARSCWSLDEIAELRQAVRRRLSMEKTEGISPQEVVEVTSSKAEGKLPVTVDAGAHMISAMTFWEANQADSVFISNGLASMAFSLPAAIAVSLERSDRHVIAFTGDGGLLMCLGELATAVQNHCNIVVIVFSDGSLSLIDIKQQARGLKSAGVKLAHQDFGQIMDSMGGRGWSVETLGDFEVALNEALRCKGPSLIDVKVNPGQYRAQLTALRH